jgi:hypothetical protein
MLVLMVGLLWRIVVMVVWLNVSSVFVAVLLVLVVKLLVMELLVKVIVCVPKVVEADRPSWVRSVSLVVMA